MAEDTIALAVYGATGALGTQVLVALEGEGLPVHHFVAVSGARSAGAEVRFRGRAVSVVSPAEVDKDALDVAILAIPAEPAERIHAELVAAGVLVIDLSAYGRRDPAVPLIWPTLNREAAEEHSGSLAIPCAAAATLAPIVQTLSTLGDLTGLDVVALLSATDAGREGEQALSRQTVALLQFGIPDPGPFGGVLAFNVLPGSSRASHGEDPIEQELLMELPRLVPAVAGVDLRVASVQVPLFAGIGLVVTARFDGEGPPLEQVVAALDARAEILRVEEGPAVRDSLDLDEVSIGQLRRDSDGVLRFFACADGLHRTASAVATLLDDVIKRDLW